MQNYAFIPNNPKKSKKLPISFQYLLLTLQTENCNSGTFYKVFYVDKEIIFLIFMDFILLITVILTAVVLVVGAYVVAKLIGPRSYNPVKGQPFECGIPTRGTSWIPVHVGYYLFAILFLMFDIETLFLYPWAVVVKQYGVMALASVGFFMLVLVFGLAYAWRKGALEWK